MRYNSAAAYHISQCCYFCMNKRWVSSCHFKQNTSLSTASLSILNAIIHEKLNVPTTKIQMHMKTKRVFENIQVRDTADYRVPSRP